MAKTFHSSYYERYFSRSEVERAVDSYEEYCSKNRLESEVSSEGMDPMDVLDIEAEAGGDDLLSHVLYHAIEIEGLSLDA